MVGVLTTEGSNPGETFSYTLSGPDAEGSALSRKLQRLRLHHINAEKHVPGLAQASALDLDWDFLVALRDHGRAAAESWLAAKP